MKRSPRSRLQQYLVPLVATAAVILVSGCMPAPRPSREVTSTALDERGWQVFQRQRCFSSCHFLTIASDNPKSSNSFTPDLRRTPRRSRDWYMAYLINPQAVLPWSPMPSYGSLSSDELKALSAFLQRLNREVSAPTLKLISPKEIPETPRDLAGYNAGRTVFRTYCTGCHGELGSGAGHVGHLLSPEPRDFTDVIWMSKQTEAYLFSVTTDGKPDTAMPAFKDTLSSRERALVLRYIRYFADPVAKERMELGFVAKLP